MTSPVCSTPVFHPYFLQFKHSEEYNTSRTSIHHRTFGFVVLSDIYR